MHRKIFCGTALAATVLTAGLVAALPARAALADTAVPLPISDYYQMAVDSVHGHLFFSQGLLEDSIVVTDFSGARAGTVTEPAGVAGITLSPDGGTLYAALPVVNEVVAISTTTLSQTAVYELGGDYEPLDVAVQSGKLWVSYFSEHEGSGAIGSFSLSVADPVLETNPAMGGWYDAPMLAADPTNTGNELVAADWGETPASLASYDTASDPATVRGQGSIPPHGDDFDGCDNAQDIAVTPGGSQFIPVCANPYTHYAYSTADLTQQGSYQSGQFPTAVAIASGTGLVAAGITSPTPGQNDIYVYAPGGTAPLREFNAGSGALLSRGLGVTADGAALFAVRLTANSDGTVAFILNRYDMAPLPALPAPARHAPALTISATPGTAAYRPMVHVTVRLGASASNRTVTIYAAPAGGGTATRLASGPVSAQGVLTASYPAEHSTTFTAAFSGDAGYQARADTATALVSVSVTMKLNSYFASKRIGATSVRLYHQTARLGAAITVAPDKPGECVRWEEQEHYRGAWHARPAAGCAPLGGHSTAVYRQALRHADRGSLYRVRTDYVRNKDSSNLNADSAWQYFIVQR